MPKLLPKMLASVIICSFYLIQNKNGNSIAIGFLQAKANVIRYESDFNRLVMEREEKILGVKKNIDDKLAEVSFL